MGQAEPGLGCEPRSVCWGRGSAGSPGKAAAVREPEAPWTGCLRSLLPRRTKFPPTPSSAGVLLESHLELSGSSFIRRVTWAEGEWPPGSRRRWTSQSFPGQTCPVPPRHGPSSHCLCPRGPDGCAGSQRVPGERGPSPLQAAKKIGEGPPLGQGRPSFRPWACLDC